MLVRIYLTGRVAVEARGNIVIDEGQLRGRQGRVAFTYLVLQRTRPVTRVELARSIWPEDRPPAWEEALSALISRLRGLINHDTLGPRGASISTGFGQYQLSLPADSWVDLEEAAASLDRAESALRAGDYRAAFAPATVSATIAGRPFLSGSEGDWVESQRRKLQRQRRRALDCLAKVWLLSGEPNLAVESATEALSLDPLHEGSYQTLMRALIASGNRPKAVRVYHDLRRLLAEELGLSPSAETEAIFLDVLG